MPPPVPSSKKPLAPKVPSTPPPAPVASAPRSGVATPVIAAPAPVVATPVIAPAAPVIAPPPAFVTDAHKEAHTTQTDIDLPPYFEPRPPSYVADEESDPDVRRFALEVVERRKRLTRIAATIMGVAWMLCQIACARSIASSVVDAISSDETQPASAAKAAVVKKK